MRTASAAVAAACQTGSVAAVREVAVFGVPDERLGEVPVAFVVTDREIADFLEARMEAARVTDGWAPEQNPAVNSGKDRGHSHPTDRVIQPGDFIQTDFGIRVHDMWVTDIQRFAYVLAPGETEAPPEALARFVRIDTTDAVTRTEIRAFYGGLEIGLGLFPRLQEADVRVARLLPLSQLQVGAPERREIRPHAPAHRLHVEDEVRAGARCGSVVFG